MTTAGTITHWIREYQNGNAAAAQPLWERYHCRLLGLARKALNGSTGRYSDEEDVVQNSFQSLFHGMVEGRFPRLDDRHDLWRLLVTLTARKAIDVIRRENRGRNVLVTLPAASAITILEAENARFLERVVGDEPTPELAAQLFEEYEILLGRLNEPLLQKIAVWKLEGYTNGEIAEKIGCSRRTVIRKLDVIKLIWSEEKDE